jgi:hypothetical protein
MVSSATVGARLGVHCGRILVVFECSSVQLQHSGRLTPLIEHGSARTIHIICFERRIYQMTLSVY